MHDTHPPPTTAAIALACALIAGVTGYFLGQARSIGLFGGNVISSPTTQKLQRVEDSDESSDEEDGPLGDFAGSKEECKLVLVVRTDLGMTKGMQTGSCLRGALLTLYYTGKIAAQCGHATLACYKHFLRKSSDSPPYDGSLEKGVGYDGAATHAAGRYFFPVVMPYTQPFIVVTDPRYHFDAIDLDRVQRRLKQRHVQMYVLPPCPKMWTLV